MGFRGCMLYFDKYFGQCSHYNLHMLVWKKMLMIQHTHFKQHFSARVLEKQSYSPFTLLWATLYSIYMVLNYMVLTAFVNLAAKVWRWSRTESVGQRPWRSAVRICLSALCCQTSTWEHSVHLEENVRWLHSEVFINIVSVEVRQREPQRERLGQSLGSVTIFIWFVFPPRCLFYFSHCTFSVWVKMWADSDFQVARQHWHCVGT